jgi:hypothetical protein
MSDHPHVREMRNRSCRLRAPTGEELWLISAEDLCLMKLLCGRTKDVAGLERIFARRFAPTNR